VGQQKANHKPTKHLNFTLYSQKITFEFLKSHLWSAADILRGSLDPTENLRKYKRDVTIFRSA